MAGVGFRFRWIFRSRARGLGELRSIFLIWHVAVGEVRGEIMRWYQDPTALYMVPSVDGRDAEVEVERYMKSVPSPDRGSVFPRPPLVHRSNVLR